LFSFFECGTVEFGSGCVLWKKRALLYENIYTGYFRGNFVCTVQFGNGVGSGHSSPILFRGSWFEFVNFDCILVIVLTLSVQSNGFPVSPGVNRTVVNYIFR